MLARYGAGVALAEPLLVASMKLPGLVVRPLSPRIEAKTFLVRLKSAPPSPAIDQFIVHLTETIRADLGHQLYSSEERRVGKECVRRVALGGRRYIKKKNTQ